MILNLKKAAISQRKHHDTRVVERSYEPGSTVFRRALQPHKLCSPWEGPFVVMRGVSDVVYIIAGKAKTYAIHHDRLKPYESEQLPEWAKKKIAEAKRERSVISK